MTHPNPKQPGHNGRYEPASATVESPYFKGEYETVTRNICESPADQMRARRQIDEAQHRADARFRQLYEAAQERKSFGVSDYTREPVCVSAAFSAPVSDHRLTAIKHLERLRSVLGERDDKIVRHISGQLMPVHQVAAIWSNCDKPKKSDREYIGRRFRDALTELAKVFGYRS